ncbi:hypothetical protein C8F04DRAFT_1190895 [Mycena alexandri]|uniref:RING-type domain-containing protein n=1 Tax=Mycena alexandri TaxID=1745969 RepID=A0AAD6SDR9_9AGAR|nr:hypothetical protein C8F04DRAFT_1190895 [Mycena alexandri]
MPRGNPPTRRPRPVGTADNPFLVDENGHLSSLPDHSPQQALAARVGFAISVPLIVSILVDRSHLRPPLWHAPVSAVDPRRGRLGARAPRDEDNPLEPTLYLDAIRPPVQLADDADLQCVICFHVKSHPVKAACNHSYCFVCIRQWLQVQWNCPSCRATMFSPPIPDDDTAKAVALAHPEWKDRSTVTHAWDGLTFPTKFPLFDSP